MNICTPGRSFMPRLLTVVAVALTVLVGAHQAVAQTQYIPYFGKNQIRYDNFKWQIYTTDHFEIYYYPEIEPQLEQIASYAESAYQHVSSELKHDLAFKVPLILFRRPASSISRTSIRAPHRKASARSPNRAATAS
jgi:hypothetical protein